MDMGNLPAGMYILRFQSLRRDWGHVERVIKQ